MKRSQQVFRKPSSSKVIQSSLPGFYPIEYNDTRVSSNTQYLNPSKIRPIPFNQSSAINFRNAPIENTGKFNSTLKLNSAQNGTPQQTKIYFSYNPRTATVERHFIQTIIRQTEKPYTNQWERKYYDLYKQINDLLVHNQKISQQFLKIREELKISNEAAIQSTIDSFTRTQSLMENNNREQNHELRENYERIKSSLQKSQHEASLFKEQNIRRQNMIEKLQSELISQKNLTFKIEMEKSQISNQNVKISYELKEALAEKVRLQGQIYDLKLALASKNIQLEQFSAERQNIKKFQQRIRSPEKMSQQNFEQKLTRIRIQYEKKEKKFEKLIETKQKQNSDIRKFITEVEEKERASRQLKENYEKLYNEKKVEVANLLKIQQSLLGSDESSRKIVFYEQKINQLNKLAGEQAEKIKQLEEAKKELNKKIDQYQDNYVTQEHLNYLHSVVETKQNQILEEGGLNYDELNNKATSYFNGKVFEEKMVYQLKKDNQKLMELVRKINFKNLVLPSQIIYNQNTVIHNESGGISMEMQNMISDIFFKLDRVTEGMKVGSNRSSQMIQSLKQISPPKQKKSKQSPRKGKRKSDGQSEGQSQTGITYKISHELDTLKVYIVNLSATCDRLVRQLQKQQEQRAHFEKQHKQSLRKQMKISDMVPRDEEIIGFYKLKNKELQDRVNQLISLCNSLKQKLCERRIEENSGENYWRNQVKATKQQLQELKSRYSKLLQKLKVSEDLKQQFETKVALFSLEIERLTQQLIESQQKLGSHGNLHKEFQNLKLQKSNISRDLSVAEHKIQELNVRLSEYVNSLNLNENQRSNLLAKYNQASSSIQSLQYDLKDKLNKLQINSRANQNLQIQLEQLRRKYESSEKSMVRLQQQLQKTSSQFQMHKKNFSQNESESNLLKSRILQITQELQSEKRRIATLDIQISRYRLNQQQWRRKESLRQKQYEKIQTLLQSQLNENALLKQKLKTNSTNQGLRLDNFSFQKLRSRIIQTEVLINELHIESSNRNKQILAILGKNFIQILGFLSQIFGQTRIGGNSNMQNQYIQKINLLEQKVRQNTYTNSYKIEFLRSLLIQFECLVREMNVSDERNREIANLLSNDVQKGLNSLASFHLF